MRFEANLGQTDPRVKFLSRGPGYALFLTPREAVIALTKRRAGATAEAGRRREGRQRTTRAVLRLRLDGARKNPKVTGERRLPGASHYFVGRDPKRWKPGVPGYAGVRYAGVYPGIDVIYHGNRDRLEYDFVVAPNADPTAIKLRFAGAKRLTLDRRGNLLVSTPGGTVRQDKPVIYQDVGGTRRRIAGRYVIEGRNRVGFRVGAYDVRRPLTIDPVMAYSTYLGGGAGDSGASIAVDSSGSAYVTGVTSSANFPTKTGPLQDAKRGNTDAFVAKLAPGGSSLAYSTYLGGNGDDSGASIAVDSSGSAYLAGTSSSADFPTTAGSFQPALRGGSDGFVAKLGPDGKSLTYSTYLGGTSTDSGRDLAVDPSGSAYLTGATSSTDFPSRSAVQPAQRGGGDAFVAKLAPGGSSLAYSTYLGGNGDDSGASIAVDSSGSAYLAGTSSSADFPTTAGSFQPALRGGSDGFVAKVGSDGLSLVYSTYLGGAGADAGSGLAVDLAGHAHVTGSTGSADFPTTASPYQAARAGGDCFLSPNTTRKRPCTDAFVTRVNLQGSGLDYSTYLGGSSAVDPNSPTDRCRRVQECNRGDDAGAGIAVDSEGNAYVTGRTESVDFPTTASALQRTYGGNDCRNTAQSFSQYRMPQPCADAFLVKLPAAGSTLAYSTYIGGNRDDVGSALALDAVGNMYATGRTDSNDFPFVDPVQADVAGNADAFVLKVGPQDPTGPEVTGLSSRGGPTSGGTEIVIEGARLAGATAVRFGNDPASSVSVDPSGNRITATTPARIGGPVFVTVTTPQGTSAATPRSRFHYGEGGWRPTGALGTARYGGHTATVLPDGKVLVAGGCCDTAGLPLKSAELYDPVQGTWTPTGDLVNARSDHTATLLPNGKVLVAGGLDPALYPYPNMTAELYDPATGRWTSTGNLNDDRYGHTATLLTGDAAACGANCGKVLIDGGYSKSLTPPPAGCGCLIPTRVAEIYDPGTGSFRPTGTHDGRVYSSATLLNTGEAACGINCGNVLLMSGLSNLFSFPRPELYEPKGEVFKLSESSVPINRLFHARTVISGPPEVCDGNCGKVLYAGGDPGMSAGGGTDVPTATADLFDPAARTFAPTGVMATPRFGHVGARLASGKFVVAGGFNGGPLNSAEVYDPAPGTWKSAGAMVAERAIQDFEAPPDPRCPSGEGTGGFCGAGAQGQPIFSHPGPTATLLSSDDGSFQSDPKVCGANCGKVLIVGGHRGTSTELYIPPPAITTLSPAEGASGGGTAVTITGSGLSGVKAVRFGDVAATSYTVESDNKITAVSPRPAGPGLVDVTVVSDGGVAKSPIRFRYGPDTVAPARVTDLAASALSTTRIKLTFSAPGSDGSDPPPARRYVVKQSATRIAATGFDRARSLCGGVCTFSPQRVGDRITLTVTGLNPGKTYHYALRARDEAGNLGAVSNSARATTPAGARDRRPPVITRFSIRPKRFRVRPARAPRSPAKRRRRAPAGATFTYRLSEKAGVRLVIHRRSGGRRVGSSCRRVTRRNRGRRRCVRLTRIGSLRRSATRRGANRIRFGGRIVRRSLKRGRYRASIQATDRAGNRSRTRRLTFSVLRR